MKLWAIVVLLIAGSAAVAADRTCAVSEQQSYERTIARFYAGEVTKTEVAKSQLEWLKASHKCGETGDVQYCYEAGTAFTTYVTGLDEQLRFGTRTEAELKAAKQGFEELHKFCDNLYRGSK